MLPHRVNMSVKRACRVAAGTEQGLAMLHWPSQAVICLMDPNIKREWTL